MARRRPERPVAAAALAAGLGLAAAGGPWPGGLAPARAGEADVLAVEVTCEDGLCLFAVTVRHADEGWAHHADRWEVLAPDGTVIATRELTHPHREEQPFTRRLPGIRIPEGVARVRVRAHDSVHGYGGAELEVDVPPGADAPGDADGGAGATGSGSADGGAGATGSGSADGGAGDGAADAGGSAD